jgi:hypothetical protein
MTHTLHRFGKAESFKDDFIIIAIPSKGYNDKDSIPKLKEFLTLCAKHNPINMGNGSFSALSPEIGLKPSAHWKRKSIYNWERVIEGVGKSGLVSAVFGTMEDAEACLKDVVKADLGLSVNLSASIESSKKVATDCEIKRHSIEYSLEFNDPHENLPDSQVLSLSTMCGHGMISFNMAKKMIEMVCEGRRSPEEASNTLARFCSCGIFNPERARRILEEIIAKGDKI